MPSDPAEGNAEVIGLLEQCLAHAREGNARYAVVVMCEMDKMKAGLAGDNGLLVPARKGIAMTAESIDAQILNATPPDPDPELGADYACYKVPGATLSFDFVTWLIDAEMTRRRAGAPAPLKVGFFLGRDGNAGGLDVPKRRKFFDNVIRPSLALLGAVEDECALRGSSKEVCALRDVVKASRAGETVPAFTPSEKARKFVREMVGGKKPPVTITLREDKQWPSRNSNVKDWMLFADYLVERYQENVIFVRDTAKAWQPLDGYASCPWASLNLDTRTALYEAAKANLFVSNGPPIVALTGERPWLLFLKLEDDGHSYVPNTPKYWRENMGMKPGDQFPWAREKQRIVWSPDDYGAIVAAWELFIA